jgi:hypothetical protein
LISTFVALAWFPRPRVLSGGAAYDEIYLMALAGRAAQAPSPIDDGRSLAVALDLIGHIRLRSVPAALAPHEQPDLRRERLAQRHRCRLAVASRSGHYFPMPPVDLADEEYPGQYLNRAKDAIFNASPIKLWDCANATGASRCSRP